MVDSHLVSLEKEMVDKWKPQFIRMFDGVGMEEAKSLEKAETLEDLFKPLIALVKDLSG